MRKLSDWWRLDGKIVAYEILLLLLFLGPILKNVPAIKGWLPDSSYALLLLAASLFLLLQIVMTLLGEKRDEVHIVTLNPTSADFNKAIKKARQVDIAFSSTETLFPYIEDALLASKMRCRVLLRNPEAGSARMRNKLLDYEARWKNLGVSNGKFKVQVKYCNNTVFRLIILDATEAYLGFYMVSGSRLLGHNVPMLHVEAGTPLGDYLLTMARNRFEATWTAGSETLGERPSFV